MLNLLVYVYILLSGLGVPELLQKGPLSNAPRKHSDPSLNESELLFYLGTQRFLRLSSEAPFSVS